MGNPHGINYGHGTHSTLPFIQKNIYNNNVKCDRVRKEKITLPGNALVQIYWLLYI
jgi:hypothetical protein